MKKAGWRKNAIAAAVVCCLFGLTLPVCVAADKKPADAKQVDPKDAARKEVVRQARAAYYNLRDQGFVQFQVKIVPDWGPVLDPLRKTAQPGQIERATQMLGGLHFSMSLDGANKVQVTHSADAPAPNPEAAKGFNQIFEGMEQAIKGFFDTWSPFMLTSMFPQVDGKYQVEELGDKYRVTYKEDDVDIVLTMNKDFVLSEARITSPQFDSAIWPEFTKTPKGFVLSGYKADYHSATDITKLAIKIKNLEVNDLQLPGKLSIDAFYNGNPYVMELAFADYKVEKK